MPGVPERRSHSYVRHGTTSLFAALDVASGFVIGKCYKRHRAAEFLIRHNQNPRPFKWTKSADQILASVKPFCHKAQQTLCGEL